ncbi:hypothetical protein BKA62DRAFT_770666 [Auriculariales sp. MPI-PUGE-AT-0066]|nr:hypothetical protein BKA62DRAFT_770666 [Auriculariales sp. MPI-PUGE-AT-0066]
MPLLPISVDNKLYWEGDIFVKIVNFLVYVVFLGFDVEDPHWGRRDYQSGTWTLIIPATWVWNIWTAIHTLLLSYIVYQFFPVAKNGVGWRFSAVVILNEIYTALWNRGHTVAAFIFSIVVSIAVSHTYYHVKVHHTSETLTEEVFIHWPFGLWHAWSTYLVILTGFNAFESMELTGDEYYYLEIVFVFISLLFLECLSAGYAFGNKDGDIAGSAAITWTLFAIYDGRWYPSFVRWSVLVFAILSLVWVGRAAYQIWQRGRRGIVLESEGELSVSDH